LPRRPIRMTLLTEPDMRTSLSRGGCEGAVLRFWRDARSLAAATGGRHADTQLLQPLARQFRLVCVRETLDQGTQFAHARRFLVEFQESITLLELRRRQFVPGGIAFDTLVVVIDSLGVFLLAVIALTDVELGVGGSIAVTVILQIILKGLDRQRPLPAVVITQAGAVKRISVWHRIARLGLARGGGWIRSG